MSLSHDGGLWSYSPVSDLPWSQNWTTISIMGLGQGNNSNVSLFECAKLNALLFFVLFFLTAQTISALLKPLITEN